ncbi:hypothetical protein Hanom_Chr03g00196451 [Helianthus anomalus]
MFSVCGLSGNQEDRRRRGGLAGKSDPRYLAGTPSCTAALPPHQFAGEREKRGVLFGLSFVCVCIEIWVS